MAQILTSPNLAAILLGGFLPTLLWLWFWLKEDPHPEPRKTLITSFVLGMLAVPAVLLAEYLFYRAAIKLGIIERGEITSLFLLFGWAFLEEGAKFLTAWWADLKRSVYDEPVDALIYLITVALGFAALENVLFISNLVKEGTLVSLITANLRFFGATLLHTVTAGVMGVSIAFSFFHKERRRRNIWGGIILATLLHGAFNAFIIQEASGTNILKTFSAVWALVIFLIFFFEKVKRIQS
ncbi:PrsW family intramembrane metalloprotease [Candidatus Giovannonibacteria bacterium]|nr:PrsW family intramembrane metalloprotease [Candidatus Giovannonibacteria bacterium]